MYSPPTYSEIIVVARDVIDTLKSIGIDACFLGGLACRLYGTTRTPNDIDVLCLSNAWEQESLKRELARVNRNFYLVASRNPRATYKVLWYRVYGYGSRRVKVDILFPGILDIPDIPISKIDRNNSHNLPCMPLSPLLLLKLQGWIHHGEALESRYRMKQPADVRDINDLLRIAARMNIRPRTETYLPQSFISRAEHRIVKYVAAQRSSKHNWSALGFDVPIPNVTSSVHDSLVASLASDFARELNF